MRVKMFVVVTGLSHGRILWPVSDITQQSFDVFFLQRLPEPDKKATSSPSLSVNI